jgi:hypothetical protein
MEPEVERAIERMHAPIGKLVVGFEHLADTLRQISVRCFEHHGLAKPSLAQLALSGLTAGPLLAAFESLVRESTKLTGSQEDLLSEIVRRTRPLIQKRNIVIHGHWHWIDFATFPEGLPHGLVQMSRRTASGLKTDLQVFKPGDIDPILEEIDNVLGLARRLQDELAAGN